MSGNQVFDNSIPFINDIINKIDGPTIIGVSGPQGSGKTTISERLTDYVNDNFDLNAISILLDDFYLTYQDQNKLNQLCIDQYDDNRLLQGRGLPGTHDIELLNIVLEKFKHQQPFDVVQYDKSLHNGKGDRLPNAKAYNPPKIDVIFLEGWFLGFKPLANISQVYHANHDPIIKSHKLAHIQQINDFLSQYQFAFQCCQYTVILETSNTHNVYTWRLQQEHKLIHDKGMGMTDDEVSQFIDRYMPVYKLYYENLCKNGLSDGGNNLILTIDIERHVEGTKVV